MDIGLPDLDGLLYASRLIGADTDLVVWGGGNPSVKRHEIDYRGRTTRVLRVKGSGSDLKAAQDNVRRQLTVIVDAVTKDYEIARYRELVRES